MTIKRLDYSKDRELLYLMYKYEEDIFKEAAVGQYNVVPFSKYGDCFCIYEDKEIYSAVQVLYNREDVAYIYGLSTAPDKRHKKYATKILEYVLDYLKKEGIKKVELTVSPDNIAAIGLYKKHGFEIEKRSSNHYFDGEDRYIMSRKMGECDGTLFY